MNTQLDDLILVLKAARDRFDSMRVQRDERMEQLKQDPDYLAFLDACDLHFEEVRVIETQIRDLALSEYAATKNKKPHEKVVVKIFETFKVTDSNKVLAWVKTNLADALIYDDKKVKNYATKIGPVDGTELGSEARAQIASEL